MRRFRLINGNNCSTFCIKYATENLIHRNRLKNIETILDICEFYELRTIFRFNIDCNATRGLYD